jgi:hypothetical protein
MAKTLWVEISLAGQGLSGAEALEVRNAIEEQIEDCDIGEVVGGGCATDGSSCDFELNAANLKTAEKELKKLLAHAGLLEGTTIRDM